ncbi:Fic family protein [Bifidobacterium sp. BRDM6]|uniref:Fic family protein n=1 Tax=Bifidobacterium choloepi TaxID=2614131 RepID=A0A6I5NJ93_9BIFI|nr:Fic family protein [Bifidobacterium choloepi]NEG70453.1 Fic family protein [Bifidobacterium choloepi]
MNATDADQQAAIELAKRLEIDLMWKTANIEVDGITFPDTATIVEGRAPANMSVDDIVVVNNIKHAWQFLFDNVRYPLDWSYVSEYNRTLGEGLIRDAGALRTIDVRIGGTDWIPVIPTLETSHDLIEDLNLSVEDPVDRAIGAMCAIMRGQWFVDGNKRTALMAANHILIHEGIGIFSVPPAGKPEFLTLLLTYYETGDATALAEWCREYAVDYLPGGLSLHQQKTRK